LHRLSHGVTPELAAAADACRSRYRGPAAALSLRVSLSCSCTGLQRGSAALLDRSSQSLIPRPCSIPSHRRATLRQLLLPFPLLEGSASGRARPLLFRDHISSVLSAARLNKAQVQKRSPIQNGVSICRSEVHSGIRMSVNMREQSKI
jgi:hypothetical protein